MSARTAIVVGSGPNGMAAAIVLARAGWNVEVWEAAAEAGGGARSAELTLPGFVHDLGSAVHPMAVASPFFSELPLSEHGLEWRWSPAELAHPLDDGTAVILRRSVDDTAVDLKTDAAAYRRLFVPLVRNWNPLLQDVLRPLLHIPRHPLVLSRFGVRAIYPISLLARYMFRGERARALMAGLGAHSILKLSAPLTSAFALMLGGAAHAVGWPIPVGGAQSITRALEGVLHSYGGRVITNQRVSRLEELDGADLKMLDITPRQFLALAGDKLPAQFRHAMAKFQYGPGIFKVDYALREPIPWRAKECAQAITVHLGGTLEEIEASEKDAWEGRPPKRPFVLLAQPSLFDPTRAPAGGHTVWAYCHVPQGWSGSALDQIESQIERFAPGFRDCVLARRTHTTAQLEQFNSNLVGGDIGGGAGTVKQFVLRPTWRGYGTPLKGVYLCSSSTAPAGGVHGMCGANAAAVALRRILP
jgi:phytoene dehydrogenase-like protein